MTAPAPLVVVHETKRLLSDASGARLVNAILDAQAARGEAHVVLTGGSMGSAILASAVACPGQGAVDWKRVHLWWGDERCLPDGDDERNDKQCLEALTEQVALDPAKVHPVPPTDIPEGATAESAAQSYAEELMSAAEPGSASPTFDVLLLGVGPDGHIASLFPGHTGLQVDEPGAIAVHNSPKPPPDRVSLTFPTLNQAREVWFLVAGADKAPAVARGVAGDDIQRTPAAGVTGMERTLWLVDRDAASELGASATG
jgi:6-phosphogluconolactonase